MRMQCTAAAAALALFAGCTDAQRSGAGLPQQSSRSRNVQSPTTFLAGSLVIPMDTLQQDNGILTAFGLVDALLRAGVPVSIVINPTKVAGGFDILGATGHDFAVPAATFVLRNYRGAPFVVAAADRAAALPIVTAWQTAHAGTRVDDLTDVASGLVQRRLTAAPRLAVEVGGYEDVAFRYLNAAGIKDSAGNAWPAAVAASYSSPDILTSAQVAGTSGSGSDGALFGANGLPRFCSYASMHKASESTEAVREVRAFLAGNKTQAILACSAITSYENDATNGHFLSSKGVTDDSGLAVALALLGITLDLNLGILGMQPAGVLNLQPASPYAQYDLLFTPNSGAVESIGLASGSNYLGAPLLLQGVNHTNGADRMVLVSGPLDGNVANGNVTWIAGHDAGTAMPITLNPGTNGARLFLDALYQSPCTGSAGQADETVQLTAPSLTHNPAIPVSIAVTNAAGAAAGSSATISLPIPAGLSFGSASNGGAVSAGKVVWNVGSIAAGATVTVTAVLNAAVDGSYPLYAYASWFAGLTPFVSTSATSSTVLDRQPPVVTINSHPSSLSSSSSAPFTFSTPDAGSTFTCQLDLGTPAACTSPITYNGLTDGAHGFKVIATDSAGNSDTIGASWAWNIDTGLPHTTIAPVPPVTNSSSQTISFACNELGATYQCKLDAGSFASCTSPVSLTGLADGSHTFSVLCTDLTNNHEPSPATVTWTVDTTPPQTTLQPLLNTATKLTSQSVSFSCGETGATAECSLDNAAYAPCVSGDTFTGLSEGAHVIAVRCIDSAGNPDPTPALESFIVDLTAPTTSIDTGPQPTTATAVATLTFHSDDAEAEFLCTLDGSPWFACASPFTTGPLALGPHTFQVFAKDKVDNEDSTPAQKSWSVVSTPSTDGGTSTDGGSGTDGGTSTDGGSTTDGGTGTPDGGGTSTDGGSTTPDGGSTGGDTDGGTSTGGDPSTPAPTAAVHPEYSGGGGCSQSGSAQPFGLALALCAAVMFRKRKAAKVPAA